MNKKVLKLISIVTTVCIILTLFIGCGKKDEKTNTANNNAAVNSEEKNVNNKVKEEKPAVLKLFLHSRDIQEKSFSKDYIEKKTNTKLEITQVTTKELENKLNIILASGDRPDIMNYYTDVMEQKLIEGKILLPLNEYFDKYPELKKSRADDVWETMRNSDGNIYSIGYQSANPLSIIAYRKDWLDKFGLKVPETIDEYYEVANAVANKDPDGNNEKDTYAFGGYGKIDQWFDNIFGAYGALPSFWMVKDGNIVNGSVQPETKEALKFLNKLYNEKIIDPEFVTDNSARWKQKVKAGVFGAGETKLHLFDKNNFGNYYFPFKEKNPDGELVYGPPLKGASDNPIGIRRNSKKGWVRTSIYKESKNVDAALRLLSWAASEEGNMFINYGLEGEHYEIGDDGVLKRKISEQDRVKLDIDKFYIAKTALFKHSSPGFHDAIKYTAKYSIDNPVDGIIVDELIKYDEELKDITNVSFIGMIVGEKPIDGGFEEFVEEWNKRGGDKLTKALNEEYHNRHKN